MRIRPILEYGNILYSGAAATHLHHLNNLQSRIEQTCSSVFQLFLSRRNATIVGLIDYSKKYSASLIPIARRPHANRANTI